MILIKDSEFIRGECSMTKEDIRTLTIWKMNLKNDEAFNKLNFRSFSWGKCFSY